MRRHSGRRRETSDLQKLSNEAIRNFAMAHDGVAFHALYPAERSSSVVQLLYSVRGGLDRIALNRGWETVLQLHWALSQRFFRDRGSASRPREAAATPPLEWKDWRWLPEHERAAKLQAVIRDDRELGFSLSSPPLIRLAVIVLGDETHLLLLSLHPLLLEGGAGRLLLMEGLRSLIQHAQTVVASAGHEHLAEAG